MAIEATKGRKCDECCHALLEDTGYSNYTVEGTDFTCKLDKHPRGTFDQFYGAEAALRFAETCSDFIAGEPEYHTVDCPYDCVCSETQFERKANE